MTFDQTAARDAALRSPNLKESISLGAAHELAHGWFFPFLSTTMSGCNGVIVNKHTGQLFHLGSAFPPERDLDLYDRGYRFQLYDLVIVKVRDHTNTIATLRQLRIQVVEPVLEHGTLWRIPRSITMKELAEKIGFLPCTFTHVSLYFELEVLEAARTARWFEFDAREHVRSE